MTPTKKPIVNCHTHIFTRDHVPPFLAKSLVFSPFYYLINLRFITGLIKKWLKFSGDQQYDPNSTYNRLKSFFKELRGNILSGNILKIIVFWISINALVICIKWLSKVSPLSSKLADKIERAIHFLEEYYIVLAKPSKALSILLLLIVIFLIPNTRKIIFTVLKSLWRFLRFIPGKHTLSLLDRYLLLGRFALYKTQNGIFTRLKNQYPEDTRFVVLPMDMKYMDAGKLRPEGDFRLQMAELVKMKRGSRGKYLEPFVFVDPRRIREEGSRFFDYEIQNGQVVLKDCDIKDYIEKEHFSGFKIYPALGYYPFDKHLLALWKYAADNALPIMTHAIGGSVYYRGKKKKDWNQHPVFKESDGKGNMRPLALPEKKNSQFSVNFTHPLNYLCLLSEPLLRILVGKSEDHKLQELFGYQGENQPMTHNLSHLKVCLAHFGGEEEWVKYLESDRYSFAQRLIKDRNLGIDFKINQESSINWNILSQVWKFVDWYSIMCSLIVQHKNVYADISYILSKPRILPLLKETLNPELNPHLSKRVLFGTDFYVVRNHFSEKDLLTQMMGGLSEQEFDLIARENPLSYLR